SLDPLAQPQFERRRYSLPSEAITGCQSSTWFDTLCLGSGCIGFAHTAGTWAILRGATPTPPYQKRGVDAATFYRPAAGVVTKLNRVTTPAPIKPGGRPSSFMRRGWRPLPSRFSTPKAETHLENSPSLKERISLDL